MTLLSQSRTPANFPPPKRELPKFASAAEARAAMMDCYVAGTKAERDSKTEVEKVAQHRVIDTLRQFEGWTATVDIAEAANYTRQTALDQLKASEADGVVMSRKGRKGYEWRWAA